MSVSAELKSIGHNLSFHCGLSSIIARSQGCGRILMYHGVTPGNVQAVSDQLHYLARNFKVVSLETLVNRLAKDHNPVAHEVVLTFDDGLRNNLTLLYPILRALQLPATFFVCPALVESGAWLWNHEMRCRLKMLAWPALNQLCLRLFAPSGDAEGIVEWMKGLRLSQRQIAESVIRHATPDFEPTPSQRVAFDMMSWDDLLKLDPNLITIGSHTMTHPILTALTAQEIEGELFDSREWLEQRLQRAVDFFCYPNGAYDKRVYQAVKTMYRAAVSTESGVVDRRNAFDVHRLPRIPSAETTALTAWRLHRPEA